MSKKSQQKQRHTRVELYVANVSGSSVDVTPKSPICSDVFVSQTAGSMGEEVEEQRDHPVEFLVINQTDFPSRLLLVYECGSSEEVVGPDGSRTLCEEIISIPSRRYRIVKTVKNLVCVKCIQGWEMCSWRNEELSLFRCSSLVTIRIAQDFLAEHTLLETDMGRQPMYMTLSGFERGNFCRVKSHRHNGIGADDL
jgi:hypothetical protein